MYENTKFLWLKWMEWKSRISQILRRMAEKRWKCGIITPKAEWLACLALAGQPTGQAMILNKTWPKPSGWKKSAGYAEQFRSMHCARLSGFCVVLLSLPYLASQKLTKHQFLNTLSFYRSYHILYIQLPTVYRRLFIALIVWFLLTDFL